ncbi:hypothetical protein [Halobacillus trueperi]|uniref:Uncharacterized protein n=1 Tax=Halobacillus trueperi TaxID=156205 RepID=A0A3E0J4X4_9BACI|nr:hypothetical protein [Halobacillus trueperi]REJ07956.1 hypothetical protein DYE48_15045 [Halobacillus trueperi]REJ07961.1 hypothetical protein DYE48_15080 [Halobacillus trueperi]
MFWWIIGFLNIVLAVVELIVAFKNEDKHLSWIHVMYSLMFISYSFSAFNQNLLYGIPGLIIGLYAIFLKFRN